jgi:hypothetical protein
MAKWTVAALKKRIREELRDAKYYADHGELKLSSDERRHAKHLQLLLDKLLAKREAKK